MTDQVDIAEDEVKGLDVDVKKQEPGDQEKMRFWTSAKNFDEYEAEEEAREKTFQVRETAEALTIFADNIIHSDEDDKPGAIARMLDQAKNRFMALFGSSNKEQETEEDLTKVQDDNSSIMITKNAKGDYIWMARYSNNARDIDNPPEIIASKSHTRFVDMVDKGAYPPPELWIWHYKNWKIGDGEIVAYDAETGFAIAAGVIDPDKHEIAKEIAAIDPTLIRVSHGMPNGSIVRSKEDPTVIIEHQTKEISILPYWAAANPLTGFILSAQKEKENMIDPEKTRKLQELGVSPETLEAVELANANDKAKVNDSGIETKEKAEVTEEVTPEVQATPEPEAELTSQEPAKEVPEPPEVKEIPAQLSVDDIATVIKAVVDPLILRVAELEAQVKTVNATDQEKFEKQVALTPQDALMAAVASVIGNKEAAIDGRTKEGKDGPRQSDPGTQNGIGIPLLTNMDNWRDTISQLEPQ